MSGVVSHSAHHKWSVESIALNLVLWSCDELHVFGNDFDKRNLNSQRN